MKRIFFALPLILAATAAFAAGTTVTNNSGLPIDELFASKPGLASWGGNLMEGIGEGALDNGRSHQVAAIEDGVYDLKISAPDEGVLCVISNVEVKNARIDLTAEHGKACK